MLRDRTAAYALLSRIVLEANLKLDFRPRQ